MTTWTRTTFLILGLLALGPGAASADPLLTSWYMEHSGRYARLYTTTAAESNRNASVTWSRGQGNQTLPTYPGVNEISYSDNWVYIRTTGLGSHLMGPWYLNAAKTQLFPNYPANIATIYRFPRDPGLAPTNKVLTGLGAIGFFVDGVTMFDNRDAFSYSNANGADATPMTAFTGDGIWNRDAYVNESVTFDAANAHQAGARYHYHANPPALRHQLGDGVSYDAVNNRYTEVGSAEHSPIIGWVRDGYPMYGPYGYSNPTNATSGIRRMRSGFEKRVITQRQVLPAWAARWQGYTGAGNSNEHALAANEFGPNVNAQYVIGHYLEDYAYLGDLGFVYGLDFDLDQHNGRFCVTPEFPDGTYAYFVSIEVDGTPRFPYNIGRQFYGSPTGSAQANIGETVTIHAEGGPEKPLDIEAPAADLVTDEVTLTYNAVEGGFYKVAATDDLMTPNWVVLASNLTANAERMPFVEAGGLTDRTNRYYQVTLYGLTTFDDDGFDYDSGDVTPTDPGVYPASGNRGSTIEVTIILDAGSVPPLPPAGAPVNSVTFDGINATNIARSSQTTITVTLSIPGDRDPGPVNIVISFPGPSYTLVNAFTIL